MADKIVKSHYFAFDDEFFINHQNKLLFILNTSIIKKFFRYAFRINGGRSSVGNRKIFKISKNAIHWKTPNLIITPHVAAHYPERPRDLEKLFEHQLGRYLKNEPLENVINFEELSLC